MIRYSFVHIPVICAAFLFMSCDANGGGVFSYTGGSRAGLSSLVVVPVRREYPVENAVFNRRSDFTVLGVYPDGTTRIFDPGIVAVSIGEDGVPLIEDTYKFEESGEHFIHVSYAGQYGRYAIWVLADNEAPNWTDGPGGGIVIQIH